MWLLLRTRSICLSVSILEGKRASMAGSVRSRMRDGSSCSRGWPMNVARKALLVLRCGTGSGNVGERAHLDLGRQARDDPTVVGAGDGPAPLHEGRDGRAGPRQ